MNNTKEQQILTKLATPLILLATIIWGGSFVVMKSSVEYFPTFWLLAIRFTISALVLGLIFHKRLKIVDKTYLVRGSIMGFLLFLAYVFQTFGVAQTTAGKNAFLTAVYCVIVPFLYWAVQKIRPDRYNILAAVLCIAGIGFVALNGDFTVNMGDVLTLVGGFFFATHIVAVARYAKGLDIFMLTTIQFASFGIFAFICVPISGQTIPAGAFTPSMIGAFVFMILAASCGALLFQNIGQAYLPPATAAVLLALEAPFGVIFSILFADEVLTPLMVLGFALILIAVICSETKFEFLRKKK